MSYIYLKEKLNITPIGEERDMLELEKKQDDEKVFEMKFIVVGGSLTGKSSFCKRFALNEFELEIKPSTETECFFRTIIIFDRVIRIYLIIPSKNLKPDEEKIIYKDINGIIGIYDITQVESFNEIGKFINETKKKINWNENIPILILGNKNDLKFLRNITFTEARKKAEKLGCEIREMNCNEDENLVHYIMKYLISKVYYINLNDKEKEELKEKAK